MSKIETLQVSLEKMIQRVLSSFSTTTKGYDVALASLEDNKEVQELVAELQRAHLQNLSTIIDMGEMLVKTAIVLEAVTEADEK